MVASATRSPSIGILCRVNVASRFNAPNARRRREVRSNSIANESTSVRPGITSIVSVGNDPKVEVAALARLLSGVVLYASIHMLVLLT